MRGFYGSCLRVCLVLVGCIAFAIQVSAVTLGTIRVTDETGVSQTLTAPQFIYSDLHQDYMRDHFEVVLSPTKAAWVHFSQIKTAEFKKIGMAPLNILITLHDGQVLSGTFPDDKLEIRGKYDSEEVTLNVEDVKTIDFVQFSEGYGEDKTILNPEEASSKWQQERKRLRVWTIVDGDEGNLANSLAIRDSYQTNRSGSWIYSVKRVRKANVLDDEIMLVGDRILVDVPLNDITKLEFTGKTVLGKPEVVVSKTDGSVGTFVLLMRTDIYYYISDNVNIVYGDFDEDDFIIYQATYGWEGICILPLRRIVCKAEL